MTDTNLEQQLREACEISYSGASGPGGQNVNKRSTKATARLNLEQCSCFSDEQKEHLLRSEILKPYLTKKKELLMHCEEERTQKANREQVLQNLTEVIKKGLEKKKKRKKTKPPKAAREKRIQEKKEQSEKKQRRRFKPE